MTIYFDKLDDKFSSASVPCGLVELNTRPGIYRNFFKRFLDVSFIVLTAPIVVPVVLILAFWVSRDGSSAFYWSTRVGKNGSEFRMMKLRTMVPNADQLLEKHLASDPAAAAEWESTQKLKCDPRTTSVGRFLRKTSLDELPQLWNVFVGDMSLVGPRPMMTSQRAIYPGLAYYALRPGITGVWQVSDRNESEFAKRAYHDKQYEQDLSLKMDLGVLAKTFGVVLRGTGY